MAATLKSANESIETYIEFTPKRDCSRVYIQDLKNYSIDLTKNEGTIEFNGYYYVNDPSDDEPKDEWTYHRRYSETLPTILLMYVYVMDGEAKPVPGEPGSFRQEIISADHYLVQVYKRDIIQNTDVISTIEDEDGSEMNVCFFPTDHQRLHFQILKVVKGNEIPEEMLN